MKRRAVGAWIQQIGGLVVVAGLLWLALRIFEWRNIYMPRAALEQTPGDLGVAFEEVEFVAEDAARLHGWWVPADRPRGTLVFFHGNAENIGDLAWAAVELRTLRVNVFLVDYRGYGKSAGLPTEQGTYRDARAAYEVARARHQDAEAPPVVLFGRSLGAAVAVRLASERPVSGVVLESAFTSAPDMARRLFPGLPLHRVLRFRYDALSRIDRIGAPLLLAHSRDDEIVPFEMSRALFERAAEPKQLLELRGGHNDALWHDNPGYWPALAAFLDAALGPGGTGEGADGGSR